MKNVASREKSIARKGQRKKGIKNKNNKVRSHTVHTTRRASKPPSSPADYARNNAGSKI